ncbi:TniQ protein [Mucilaginibacter gracilis]|uniref:TniQ protein n=1 Tax=Mucilaginibacter gracilis TaxID=423350 RepID=A0A495IZD0_9SPHI|nr:TniQ family protein [Mucilaginibacter gracilis]RKR82076.1 TniQ protein [Mucilaginibacter gracilis]
MSFAVLGNENKLLPAFCKPYADELLSCWLTRMAFNHGLTTKELCQYIWPNYSGNPDIDRTISKAHIGILAARTNCKIAEVESATLSSYQLIVFNSLNIVYGQERWLIPSKKARAGHCSGLMFCPACLKTQPYFRKNWRLAISFACTSCGCYLCESCPHCGQGNSFIDVAECNFAEQTLRAYLLNCHHCGKDVTECTPEIAPPAFVKLQQQLYDVIDHGLHDQMVYTESYFRVLHHLASLMITAKHSALKIRRFADQVYRQNSLPIERFKGERLEIRNLPLKQRTHAIKAAHWLLQEWPHRFIEIALNNHLKRKDVFDEFPNAPFWFWEPLYYGMGASLPVQTERLSFDNFDLCTARLKEEPIQPPDYDFNIDEAFYNDEMYKDNDEGDYIPNGYTEDIEGNEEEEEPAWSFDY